MFNQNAIKITKEFGQFLKSWKFFKQSLDLRKIFRKFLNENF